MKIRQLFYSIDQGWSESGDLLDNPQLVLVFGAVPLLRDFRNMQYLMHKFPSSQIVHASTSGEIWQSRVMSNTIVVSAIEFEKTSIVVKQKNIHEVFSAFDLGKSLYNELLADDLVHILVISDGNLLNGSELVGGLNSKNSKLIPITGGLAGDDAKFEQSWVGLNNQFLTGNVIGIGFYGKHLRVGHGSCGGWDPFGPERIVTKSNRNVLYDLDYQSALSLYKKYLGPLSDQLPGSALHIPLSLKIPDTKEVLVRTVLSINEKEQSMTFAGNLPQGSKVQLMKASFDKLIDGAAIAAANSLKLLDQRIPQFTLIISCVGRKIVLNQRIEDEVDEAVHVLGSTGKVTGFYSNGEISPLLFNSKCELHNQTITVTTYCEV